MATSSHTHLQDGANHVIHTGIIKALNIADAGSFVAWGIDVDSTPLGKFDIEAGGFFRKGEYVGFSAINNTNDLTNWVGHNTYDWYGLICIADGSQDGESLNEIVFRKPDTIGAIKVADPKEGDIPICVVQIEKDSDAATSRKTQYLGMKKTSAALSVGEEVSSAYTERLKIHVVSNAPRITVGGQAWTFGGTGGVIARTADIPSGDGILDWTDEVSGKVIHATNYTDTTYSVFDASNAGLVPVKDAGGTSTKFLREDGDWVIPTDTDTNTQTTYTPSWVDSNQHAILRLTPGGEGAGGTNQDILLQAGENITLTPSSNGEELEIKSADTNTTYPDVTATAGGVLTNAQAVKFDGIATGATNTAAPHYTSAIPEITSTAGGLLSDANAVKFATITSGAGVPRTDSEINALAQAKIDDLIDGAPGALNTLNEIAAAFNDDAAFNTTITNAIALKAPLASPTFTGTVAGITKAMVGLTDVDDLSAADIRAGTTATNVGLGDVSNITTAAMRAGVTAANVDLGNVTNESKATMFANPTFTGEIGIGDVNVSETELGLLEGATSLGAGSLASLGITATAAEINILDGVASGLTAAEISILDGGLAAVRPDATPSSMFISAAVAVIPNDAKEPAPNEVAPSRRPSSVSLTLTSPIPISPVNVGLANIVAFDSLVTFPKSTLAAVTPALMAAVVMFETSPNPTLVAVVPALMSAALKSSTSVNPTIAFVIPATVPVKVGEANGAFNAIAFVMVVLNAASSLNAAAISFNVFNAPGAPSIKSSIFACARALISESVLGTPAPEVIVANFTAFASDNKPPAVEVISGIADV
jgi:hypothetical protein